MRSCEAVGKYNNNHNIFIWKLNRHWKTGCNYYNTNSILFNSFVIYTYWTNFICVFFTSLFVVFRLFNDIFSKIPQNQTNTMHTIIFIIRLFFFLYDYWISIQMRFIFFWLKNPIKGLTLGLWWIQWWNLIYFHTQI